MKMRVGFEMLYDFPQPTPMIMVPGAPPQRAVMEMISISAVDLSDAQRIDASRPHE